MLKNGGADRELRERKEEVSDTAAKRPYRALPTLLKSIAAELGLEYTCLSHGWIHILRDTSRNIQICGGSFPLNGQSAARIVSDKSATAMMLGFHGVPCAPGRLVTGPTGMANARHKLYALARTLHPPTLSQWSQSTKTQSDGRERGLRLTLGQVNLYGRQLAIPR